jgi:hypothetical protein
MSHLPKISDSQCFPVEICFSMAPFFASPGLEQRAADGPGVAPRRGSHHGAGACGRAAGAAGPRWAWGKWPGSGEKWAKIIRPPFLFSVKMC